MINYGVLRRRTLIFALTVFLVAFPEAHAAVKTGSSCQKIGSTSNSKGVKYTCIKSGGKLIWNTGVVLQKPSSKVSPSKATVTWQYDDSTSFWQAQGKVPKCPVPLIATGDLLDFSKVVSIVQPGQIRGGSYKPHAGLRWSEFGGYVKGVTITAPFDGQISAAAHYISDGNYQFLLNIIHPCGIMLRLGHMLRPSDFVKSVLNSIPPAVENDSRESFIQSVFIKRGEVIATEVGMPPPAPPDSLGTFIDLGVVNLNAKNPLLPANFSSNADKKYSLYSVCWYEDDYFSIEDRIKAQKLPFSNGDSTSDYCKTR